MVDMCTQTDLNPPSPIKVLELPPQLPPRSPNRQSRTASPTLPGIIEFQFTEDVKSEETRDHENTEEDPRPSTLYPTFDNIDLDDSDDEEPVIAEIHQAAAPQAVTGARVVQVAKPIAPKLPLRSPFRSRFSVSNGSTDDLAHDASVSTSPMHLQSPPATPLLKGDDFSTSSLSSVEGLERASKVMQAHHPDEPYEAKDDFHSLPESPVKAVPGAFS